MTAFESVLQQALGLDLDDRAIRSMILSSEPKLGAGAERLTNTRRD